MEYTWRTKSPLGAILLAADGDALCGLWFEGQKHCAETLSSDTTGKYKYLQDYASFITLI